jgi:hypothetical protein
MNLRAALRDIKALVRAAKAEPMFVRIANGPEGLSEDDGIVASVLYEREAGESRDAFWSRLRRIAYEKGAPVYFIGSGERAPRPTLEEPRQDGQTIEIGATVQIGGVPPSP